MKVIPLNQALKLWGLAIASAGLLYASGYLVDYLYRLGTGKISDGVAGRRVVERRAFAGQRIYRRFVVLIRCQPQIAPQNGV